MPPSEERSSSAVRNLRSLFENKANDASPNTRGRSPGSLGVESEHRPRSQIRTSFFPVASPSRPSNMASPPEGTTVGSELSREPSSGRRSSFSEDKDGSAVAETNPKSAIETPLVEVNKQLGAGKVDTPAENPDKPVTGAEEEFVDMTPAEPTSEEAVSGGSSLPPVAEDLRKKATTAKAKAAPKPAAISTRTGPRPSTSSTAKSPLSGTAKSPNAPSSKPSRSSLTAPTAASVARAAAEKDAKQSSAPKPKPREATKPLDISSRLTAPTAASRAKHEAAAAPEPKITTSRVKPAATTRSAPRPSLGRPESRSSQTESKKSAAPVSGSFLERMTRPTAASSNRLQANDKPEVKNSPKSQKLPHRPKVNGQPKGAKSAAKARTAAATDEPETTVVDETVVQEEEPVEEAVEEKRAAVEEESAPEPAESVTALEGKPAGNAEPTGNETPIPSTNGHQEDPPALESTPAALGEDSIR